MFGRGNPAVTNRVLSTPTDQVAITLIAVREQLTGWYGLLNRATKPEDEIRVYERLGEAVKLCAAFNHISYSRAAIAQFEFLKSLKLIGTMDLRIAAIVLTTGATLVTRNHRDFARVPGLVLENWADAEL